MTQKISFQYRDPEDTELMNRRWEGIVEPGVKQGFEVTLGTDPPQTTITIRAGVLVTNDFCRVEETEPIIDAQPIPPNTSSDPRWDLVVCQHHYLRSVPPPVAMYAIIQGEPSNTPTLPTAPPNCVPLAYGYIPAGGVRYTEILNFITHFKYNCAWDDEEAAWRIVFGAKMALLIAITPNEAPALSVTPGMRLFIHPGGVADGDPITWTRVMELTPDGFTELVELAQEVAAARGTKASLDARLDVSLGEDGAYKRVGILDQVMDEVEAARGSMASLDARLDTVLDESGALKENTVGSVALASSLLIDANRAVGTNHIKDEAVTGAKINLATIAGSGLVVGLLNTLRVNADESSLHVDIVANHIEIADDGVKAKHIAPLAVTAGSIAELAVNAEARRYMTLSGAWPVDGIASPLAIGTGTNVPLRRFAVNVNDGMKLYLKTLRFVMDKNIFVKIYIDNPSGGGSPFSVYTFADGRSRPGAYDAPNALLYTHSGVSDMIDLWLYVRQDSGVDKSIYYYDSYELVIGFDW